VEEDRCGWEGGGGVGEEEEVGGGGKRGRGVWGRRQCEGV
jgi:hypothetical protein